MEKEIYKMDFNDMTFKDIKDIVDGMKKVENIECLIYINDILMKDKRKTVQNLSQSINKFICRREEEIVRLKKMYDFDKKFANNVLIAGVDEVGRGPLAGPIVAAAVILDLNYKNHNDLFYGLKDSKKLRAKERENLSHIIKDKALYYNIFELDNHMIDTSGIAWCNNEVLKKSTLGLEVTPGIVISDGFSIKNINIKNEYIIKGDAKSASIAAASIIAKVYRDKKMEEYSKIYTHYGFEKNSGYGTDEHTKALKKYGPCPIHRMSFLSNYI
ncbi:ribonuclease HII [Clostridium tetani]|nr:ribonuclease HII [Clostridium tetani]BDR83698.1 ribonuclease HII [Clostridium tetani]BDR86517.1 ribonuclease HII [Clostridium tetani]